MMVARTKKEIENGRTKGRILVNDQAIIRIITRIKKNNKRNGGSNKGAKKKFNNKGIQCYNYKK